MTREETREHIITIAKRLFAQQGFADTSMNMIVAETGLSKGGIYWHFKSKEQIVTSVYDQFFNAQIAFIESILQAEGSASERLHILTRMAGEAVTETTGFPYPLDLYAYALRNKPLLQSMSAYLETYLQHLAQLIQQGIDSGEFVPCDAQETALVLVSALDGIVLVAGSFVANTDIRQKLERTITLFLQGLQKR